MCFWVFGHVCSHVSIWGHGYARVVYYISNIWTKIKNHLYINILYYNINIIYKWFDKVQGVRT